MTKMPIELLVAFVLLSLISSGSALECYSCGSTESWNMCMKNRHAETCLPWHDRCYKVSVDTTFKGERITRFTKGCSSAKQCYDKTLRDCRQGINQNQQLPCNIYCCAGRMCNAGSVPVVSGIVIVTCAVLGLLFY